MIFSHFGGGKRATNNFERERAFPGRLKGVPGKRCFVNAVGNVVQADVGNGGGGGGTRVETNSDRKNLNQNGRAIFRCFLSSLPDKSFLRISRFFPPFFHPFHLTDITGFFSSRKKKKKKKEKCFFAHIS